MQSLTMPTQTRTRLEIALAILELCKKATAQTAIMNQVGLNHEQTKTLIQYLLVRGFLKRIDSLEYVTRAHALYLTTGYGREFASGLELLLQIWFGTPLLRYEKVLS